MPEIVSAPYLLALTAVVAYLLGSIPFGVLLARAFGLGDLRSIGSGNIGATNVLRTGNKAAAAATLILDGAKGAVAVLVARAMVGEDAAQLAGLAAFIGHCFPVYLKFKGGKGVATYLGTLLAVAWPVGIACCLMWLVTAIGFRFSSLAALMAALFGPVFAWGLNQAEILILACILALIVWIRHGANINRLLSGQEPRIGKK